MNTFAEWLVQHHYRESTAKKTLAELERIFVRGYNANDENQQATLRRYAAFAAETEDDATLATLAQLGVFPVVQLPSEKLKARKLAARSFNDQDWRELVDVVTGAEDPRDQVLWAMATTGLRVGDVLRVPYDALVRAATEGILMLEVKGGVIKPLALGIPAPWRALQQGLAAAQQTNVAAYVCPGDPNSLAGGCAYHRMNRRIKALKRELGLEGRVYMHRMRRTVAVRVLEETDNLTAAQQMLGHASPNTTLKYVDEANLRRTAALQRKIAGLPEE